MVPTCSDARPDPGRAGPFAEPATAGAPAVPAQAEASPVRRADPLSDLSDEPLMGLSADGVLLLANAAAIRLIERGDTFVLRDGRPVPLDPAIAAGWRAALLDALAGHRRLLWGRGPPPGRPVLLRPGPADVAPVVARTGRDADGLRAVIDAYAGAIGLTPQEARVVEGLAQGESPGTIARRHRVSIATVRTQIRNATLKAGVAGMRELVADVLRTAA